MAKRGNKVRQAVSAASLAVTLALSGCGYDVQLEGGVFEMMGVAGSTGSKKTEPKMANRSGIVVPPSTDRLPTPGSGTTNQAAADPAWPVDQEDRKVAMAAQQRKAHAEYCEKALIDAKIKEGQNHGPVMGPMGRCEPSILNMFSFSQQTE